jgi:hypothetical protein
MVFSAPVSGCRGVDVAGEADQAGGEADQAVHQRHQFGHLRHLDDFRRIEADGAADHHGAMIQGMPAAVTRGPNTVASTAMVMPIMP